MIGLHDLHLLQSMDVDKLSSSSSHESVLHILCRTQSTIISELPDTLCSGASWLKVTQQWGSAIDVYHRYCPRRYVRTRLIGRACCEGHEGRGTEGNARPMPAHHDYWLRSGWLHKKGHERATVIDGFLNTYPTQYLRQLESRHWWMEGAPKGTCNRWIFENCLSGAVSGASSTIMSPIGVPHIVSMPLHWRTVEAFVETGISSGMQHVCSCSFQRSWSAWKYEQKVAEAH
jgi:hypothetical protein